jgi:hypothetical protein
MQARNDCRKPAAAARKTRRSGLLTCLGFGAGAFASGGVMLMCLAPPQAAAQVLRGEKIGRLPAVTETNLLVVTNAAFATTNLPVSDTNKIGLPLASEFTNVVSRPVTIGDDTYRMTSFGQLAGFRFKVSQDILSMETEAQVATGLVLEQIPVEVKQLNEQAVALTGYMLPVKLKEGLVTDFMLLPNTMGCCFGRMPRINEVIIVNTTGQGFKSLKDIPITVAGTLHVGAIRNDNRLIGIYQMDCEHVVEAAALNPK